MSLIGSEDQAELMSADLPKIRAVFDCMIFLQGATRRESAAGACLLLVELDAIELCVSREIMAEVRDVLARPRVRQKFPGLTDQIVDRFLAALEERAVVVSEVPRAFQFDRDPKDEPYINLRLRRGQLPREPGQRHSGSCRCIHARWTTCSSSRPRAADSSERRLNFGGPKPTCVGCVIHVYRVSES
jgi:putative PIN family toxin of toxin-antitoxin system